MFKNMKLLIIFILALLIYVPFNSHIPITDPVESNYALTAKEMLISQDLISPRIYGNYWYDKPVMVYWLIACSYQIFGITDFAARLPSAVLSAASVVYMYWFVQRIFINSRTALFSALVLATSLEYWVLARMVITDAALFLFSSISLTAFYLGIREDKRVHYILAYAFAGLAVLTKGPIGIVLPGLIVFSYILATRQWFLFKKLFILPGLVILLIVAGPWYFLMYHIHGKDFIDTFLGLHNYLRATVSEHPEYNVFYYYLVLFPLSLLPWTGVFFQSLVRPSNRSSINAVIAYAMVWIAVTVVFYTMVATKYPTYVFPASFPAAILTGYCLVTLLQTPKRKIWLWLSIPAVFMFIGLAVATSVLSHSLSDTAPVWAVALTASVTVLWLQFKGKVRRLPLVTALFTAVISITVIHGGLTDFASERSARDIVRMLPAGAPVVASYGEYMTSAVFYSGYVIPHLIEEEDAQKSSNVWAAKYTMPTEEITHFDERTSNEPNSFVIVKDAIVKETQNQKRFENLSIGKKFARVVSFKDITLYQRRMQ